MNGTPVRAVTAPVDRAEAEAVARLLAASFPGREQVWDADAIRALAGSGAMVLRADGGAAILRVAADEAELLTIAVDPAARRSGLGAALLAAAEARARAAGAAEMILEVAAGNAAAHALYARAGYAEAGRRAGYYRLPDGTRDDALILRKRL